MDDHQSKQIESLDRVSQQESYIIKLLSDIDQIEKEKKKLEEDLLFEKLTKDSSE